ncbi:hypothetical protein [Rothia nasisuis]|uniref:hypothetical protein n=1 Tax=Rothia nasisuis TaxID=2109647 RepID=UPI001F3F4CF2|nr:hypothetical protein [Rothia nasisuis]
MTTSPQQPDSGQPGTSPDEATPSYLYEPFITPDGLEVPPPTRPMGPRRLARYYDEVAEYLRALQRGDEEPPEMPMFMGDVDGVEVPKDPTRSLANLSQMGNISSNDQGEVNVDFDETRATVLDDPLAGIEQQVYATDAYPADERAEKVDFAAATGEITGHTGFVSVDQLGLASDENTESEAEPIESATEDSGQNQTTTNSEAVTAIIARAQAKEDERQSAQSAAEGSDALVGPDHGEVTELAVSERPSAYADTAIPELPEPVPAVDAQGLDLSEIDSARTPWPLASARDATDSAVDSDSSEVDRLAPAGYTYDEPLEDDDDPTNELEQLGDNEKAESSSGTRRHRLADDANETSLSETVEAGHESGSSEVPAQTKKSGALVSMLGILLLLLIATGIWFYFLR